MMTRPARTNLLNFSIILVLLIVVPVGIIIFLTHNFYGEQQQLIQAQHLFVEQKTTPLLHIIDAILHEVEPNNRYEFNIHAQHADIMRSSSRIVCSEMNGVIFDKERKEIHFTAQQGIIAQDEKTIHFPKNLLGTFNDGTFQGSNITYHLNKYELSSPQAFTFNHPLITFQAASGTMNLKDYQGFLHGGISTTITPPGKQPPQ
jgi:LPS export ABC transporter protein LptC